jgi:hypothetical protein
LIKVSSGAVSAEAGDRVHQERREASVGRYSHAVQVKSMSPSEWGFVIIALFVIVFAAISYVVVKIWGEKKRS